MQHLDLFPKEPEEKGSEGNRRNQSTCSGCAQVQALPQTGEAASNGAPSLFCLEKRGISVQCVAHPREALNPSAMGAANPSVDQSVLRGRHEKIAN